MPSKFRAIHPVFHASKLATYNEPTIKGQAVEPPEPVLVRGKEEHEVEKILQQRVRNNRNEYLIQWKGYGRQHDAWEPEDNLENSEDILEAWKRSNEPIRRSQQKKTVRIIEAHTLDEEDQVELLLFKSNSSEDNYLREDQTTQQA